MKKTTTPILHGFEEILSEEALLDYAKERYYVIATNADDVRPKDAIIFYRKRGDTSENRIKELKNGFNLKYLPTSNFTGNAFYFSVGVLAYNLFVLFKETLEKLATLHNRNTPLYALQYRR